MIKKSYNRVRLERRDALDFQRFLQYHPIKNSVNFSLAGGRPSKALVQTA
jgi:hypothetical protein